MAELVPIPYVGNRDRFQMTLSVSEKCKLLCSDRPSVPLPLSGALCMYVGTMESKGKRQPTASWPAKVVGHSKLGRRQRG